MKCKHWSLECKRECTDKCRVENAYCPSNGSEGMYFTSEFCDHCIHDNPDYKGKPRCEILMLTMCYYPPDPQYPLEWVIDSLGHAKCTKYVEWNWDTDGSPDDPDNPKRPADPPDPRQLNLFPLYHAELIDSNVLQKST